MKKMIVVYLFTLVSTFAVASPGIGLSHLPSKKGQKTTGLDRTRLLFGGGIGAGAGYRAFSIYLAPSLGYAFTDNFTAGATLGFNYFQQAEDYTNPVTYATETFKHKYPGYSFSIYARYIIKNFLLLNFEPELNNVKFVRDYSVNLTTGKIIENAQRTTIPSVLAGVGYVQRFGRGYSFVSLNYDLLQNPNSRYYQTLDYRFGIMFQLFNN
ncbi:MAG: hypothetical protein IT257_05100 [Chitinophagaceae bacterium]|nr:hypothetical protein [Chitinophagaceae bacterium]